MINEYSFSSYTNELDKIAAVATKTDPAKWEQAKRDAKARMGGKHSARAMQLATKIYKDRGGGYSGRKPTSKSNSLKKWSKQKWGYSGKDKPGQGGSGVYLPEAKRKKHKSTEEGKAKLRSAEKKKAIATSRGEQYATHGLAAGTSLSKKASDERKKKNLLKIVKELKKASKMHAAQASKIEKMASVEYRGKTFPGYNKPIPSDKKNKKKMVLVKRGDRVKLVHFGQKGYEDFTQHKDKQRRKNYLTRSAGIKNKSGQLTKNDPFSPNYWARKELW